jgi:hypothetical protein
MPVAGDWIKMRGNLWDDPRVAKLCDLCDCGEAQVVGGLYWLWATADQHTEDGHMPGLTLRQIDRKTGIKGFGAALCSVGWLADDPHGVVIVKFEEHNGTSAKRRCTDAQRKASVRSVSASDADILKISTGQKTPNLGAREREEIEEEKREDTFSENMVGAAAAAKTTSPKKGHRLPDDWQLPKPWGDWALTEYPAWTADIVRLEAAKFADHWHAKAGKDATKTDWEATWRNWCRSPICQEAHAIRTTFAQQAADIARTTVPSKPGRDPALVQIEEDAKKAAPIPDNIREKLAALKGGVTQ